jgi:DnaJ family protein A protein 5
LDKYDLRNADDRQTIKYMERENKKLRDVGKKQRNEEIRHLVLYIRRRDPRVKVYREHLEVRKQQEFERVEQQRKDRIIRNLRYNCSLICNCYLICEFLEFCKLTHCF